LGGRTRLRRRTADDDGAGIRHLNRELSCDNLVMVFQIFSAF
jgi:hypothetical protein